MQNGSACVLNILNARLPSVFSKGGTSVNLSVHMTPGHSTAPERITFRRSELPQWFLKSSHSPQSESCACVCVCVCRLFSVLGSILRKFSNETEALSGDQQHDCLQHGPCCNCHQSQPSHSGEHLALRHGNQIEPFSPPGLANIQLQCDCC